MSCTTMTYFNISHEIQSVIIIHYQNLNPISAVKCVMFQSSVCQSVSRQTYNLDHLFFYLFFIKSVEKVEHGSRKKLLISGSDRSRVDTGNYFHNSVAPAAYELAGLATPWASRPLWRNFAFPFNQPVDNLQFNFQQKNSRGRCTPAVSECESALQRSNHYSEHII